MHIHILYTQMEKAYSSLSKRLYERREEWIEDHFKFFFYAYKNYFSFVQWRMCYYYSHSWIGMQLNTNTVIISSKHTKVLISDRFTRFPSDSLLLLRPADGGQREVDGVSKGGL